MSAENQKIKPKTSDYELFLNYANRCVWGILKHDSGSAGANAASGADMTYAATDPLSEIVWSPDKGLCIKCADSSFADRNNSLFQDVGPSNILQPIDDVFVKPIAAICDKSNIAATDSPAMHPTSISGSGGNVERIDTEKQASGLPNVRNENLVNDCEENTCDQVNNRTDKIYGIEGNKSSAISGQVGQRPFDSLPVQSHEHKSIAERNASPGRCSNEGTNIGAGKKTALSDDALYAPAPWTYLASSSKGPLEKLESSAENDLRTFNGVAACAATTSRVLVNEIERKSQDNEAMLPCDNTLPVSHSPFNSRILMTINKGKEKSLSGGDANIRIPKEDNEDSLSSVESCNSGGSFSAGKKTCNFQEQLMIGSKRVKKQIQEISGSKFYVKQDSSFVNWISNMVKGFSQSVQDDSKSVALTLPIPDHRYLQRPDEKKLITYNTSQDPKRKNTGFKSIFQSIYCPNSKNVGTRSSHQEGEGCKELEAGTTIHGIDATPIRQYLQTNKPEVSSGRYDDAGPSSQPKIKPLNFFINSRESSKDDLVENRNCSVFGLSKDKEEMASHSSSTRQKTDNTENIDSNNGLYERKEAENICHRRANLGSLWITRFSSKPVAPMIISDHLNERGGSQVQSTDCSKLPNSHKHISYLNNCKIEETRELSVDDTEACSGLKEDKGNDDHKSKHKFLPFSSSPGFRNSELMASMFARRLGAIKHSIATNTTDSTALVNLVNDSIPAREHASTSNESSARLLTGEDDRIFSGGPINVETDHQEERNLNLKRKSKEIIDSKIGCSASFKKHCSLSSEENKLKENPIASSRVPIGISDAVRKLRLSRTDILKWINTHSSISQLDGFFLRLRLGKWEEGLGGTGYHVASIHEAEAHGESSERNTRKSLSVNVGGIKCMVESQYVSNQDFLEEEIMEWWSTTLEADTEIPCEEDMIEKIRRKNLLGL